MCQIYSPHRRPLDWSDSFVPRDAEKGLFPYAIRFTVDSPTSLREDRSFFNHDRRVALLGCKPDPEHLDVFTSDRKARTYVDAVEELRVLLGNHGHVLAASHPLHSW